MPIPEKFKSWFEQVCREAKLEDVETACTEGGFVVNEVPFLFVERWVQDDAGLLLQAIVDFLPQHNGLEILKRLLEAQMMIAGPGAPVFGVDPATGVLLLVNYIEPGKLAPPDMLHTMEVTVAAVGEWRKMIHTDGRPPVSGSQKALMTRLAKA